MIVERKISDEVIKKVKNTNKIILLYGARQVGKTTLAKDIISKLGLKTLFINADEQKYNDILSSRALDRIESLVSGYQLVFIDEAQRITDIGLNLKIMVDGLPSLKIIATGSSSFELANKVSESLTGRAWTFNLYPLAVCELKKLYNEFELKSKLDDLLVFGGYPEVFTTVNHREKQNLLEEIGRSYLYKDILELATVKHSSKIKDLLKLLAFQIGSEVSINELSNSLNISRDTTERYMDLLEKSFVIFRLKGFSRNLRKEVTKMDKIFFYDLGIRNIV
ncbi:MAG: AAA family ATPase, partial [Deltaproteobacteria bacterium RIFCSPLOWO2_02_FULL_47_10]